MSRIKEDTFLQQGRYGVAKEFRGTATMSRASCSDQALVHGGTRVVSKSDPRHKVNLCRVYGPQDQPPRQFSQGVKVSPKKRRVVHKPAT